MVNNLTEGKPLKLLFFFALPMVIGNLFQQLYNMADTLIVGGTSLVVYPAAGLLRYFRGRHLVVINKTPTQADAGAELVVAEKLGKVFSDLHI